MRIKIENKKLSLIVDTLGAQMMSLQSADGTEYLWQGDPQYWPDRAPLLFPYIARLTADSYKFHGRLYHMGIHGFAAQSEFILAEASEDHVVLELNSDESTLEKYPFAFTLRVTYKLREQTVSVSYQVSNRSDATMPFGIGGHPGFRVPLEEDGKFGDYYLEFSEACQPDRVGFTPQLFLSGKDMPYPLEKGKYLPLGHQLFNEDAVILKNMAKSVILRSRKSSRSVMVSYPDMPYLGLWHCPKSDAPYICIEPWSSLPSRQGVVEEISCKSDLIHLAPGEKYHTMWTISVS